MYRRNVMALSVLVLTGLGFALSSSGFTTLGTAAAQEKKGPNVLLNPTQAKDTAKTKGLRELELASKLIQYGRKNKHAESLLVAAQILHKTPAEELKGTIEKGQEGGKVKAPNNTPKALVAEALKLSSSKAVEVLAAATEKMLEEETRSSVGAPLKAIFNLHPGQLFTSRPIDFFGGEKAAVVVDMNGVSGRMILEVSDQYGNVVARDTLPGNYYAVSWVPAVTGTYRIRLANIDTISFNCLIVSN